MLIPTYANPSGFLDDVGMQRTYSYLKIRMLIIFISSLLIDSWTFTNLLLLVACLYFDYLHIFSFITALFSRLKLKATWISIQTNGLISFKDLLRAQSLLISFLAVNGVTECFARYKSDFKICIRREFLLYLFRFKCQLNKIFNNFDLIFNNIIAKWLLKCFIQYKYNPRSVMTESEISSFNKQLVVLSCSYLVLTWALTQLVGPVGLVLANCANMAARWKN